MANDRVQKVPGGRGQSAVNMGKKMKLDKGTLKKLLKRVVLTHKMAWSLVAILILSLILFFSTISPNAASLPL